MFTPEGFNGCLVFHRRFEHVKALKQHRLVAFRNRKGDRQAASRGNGLRGQINCE